MGSMNFTLSTKCKLTFHIIMLKLIYYPIAQEEGIIMETIERIYNFLEETKSYALATVEGDQPRVRIFGTALLYNGKLYIQTGKSKDVSKQIAANPKVEICACKGAEWLRACGVLADDDSREVKVAMLEKMPNLTAMYNPDDGNMQMLYFKCGQATFSSFSSAPETVTF